MGRLYSFVLPAYKARFLKEAIDSILAQTYTNFELIIVNDASPEDLDSIVNSYDDPRIQYYINAENIGGKDLVAQWNYSITYAKGEYLILASDDDVYHMDYLQKMNTIIDRYPDVYVFRPMVQFINANGSTTYIKGLLNEYTSQLMFAYFMRNVGGGIPFYIVKREALEAINGFVNYPLAWHSDDITVLKLAKNGVVFYPEILFSFRMSGENISTKLNNADTLKMKICATNQYIGDLAELLRVSVPESNAEGFCRSKLLEELPKCKMTYLRDWFGMSSKEAVLKCYNLYRNSGCFTHKTLLLMYIRKLFLS